MSGTLRLASAFAIFLGIIAQGIFVVPPAGAQSACYELVADGEFESGDEWILGVTRLTPQYVSNAQHSGNRSLSLGLDQGVNVESYSSARQLVSLPGESESITLSFWAYTTTNDTGTGDYVEAVLLDASGLVLAKPWHEPSDTEAWQQFVFDLTPWAGRTVQLYFNVYNDGLDGTSRMLLDDVSLTGCSSGTIDVSATPYPWPTNTAIHLPTRTPSTAPTAMPTVVRVPTNVASSSTPIALPTWTPASGLVILPTETPAPVLLSTLAPATSDANGSACTSLLSNGGFEDGLADWARSPNLLTVGLTADPVHGGEVSARLGSQDQNLSSLASLRRDITIPDGDFVVTLSLWTYTWHEQNPGNDEQAVVLFAEDGSVIAQPFSGLTDDREWRRYDYAISDRAGQTISLYFNLVNDGSGGKTLMYVDDVSALACASGIGGIGSTGATTSTATTMTPGATDEAGAAVATPRPLFDGTSVSSGDGTAQPALLEITPLPGETAVSMGADGSPTVASGSAVAVVEETSTAQQEQGASTGVTARWPKGWWVAVIAVGVLAFAVIVAVFRRPH